MSIYSQYKAKKKKVVDPNAPPRPTLLGHEKVIKGVNQTIQYLTQKTQDQAEIIQNLNKKIRKLESDLSVVQYHLKKRN